MADIVAEISSSEYAIDDLLSRLTWMLHSEDAYYGHLVLRLIAYFVLYYT